MKTHAFAAQMALVRDAILSCFLVASALMAPARAQITATPLRTAASVSSIEVFANSATHVLPPTQAAQTGYSFKLYRVDGMALLEEQLSQQLPQNEADATAWMMRHEALIRRKYQARIINAANGMTLAIHYGIDRLPAIVINRQAVVYGLADVNQALDIYRQNLLPGGRS